MLNIRVYIYGENNCYSKKSKKILPKNEMKFQ